MLPSDFIIVAIVLRLAGGAKYLLSTLRGKAQPNIVSWSLWSLTALIAFASQISSKGVGAEALVTLAIGIGPLAVVVAGLVKGAHKLSVLTRLDVLCLVLALVGVILWIKTSDLLLALLMSIVADIISSIPTVAKSYRAPKSESASAYSLTIVSMVVTLLTLQQWGVMNWAFPLYILAINLTFVMLILLPKQLRYRLQRAF
jgi:hypothetical protein